MNILATYVQGEDKWFLSHCTIDDIPHHILMVQQYWPIDSLDVQEARMRKAVEAGSSYRLLDVQGNDKLFIYLEKIRKVGYVSCMWFEAKKFVAMLFYYSYMHLAYEKLYFMPHEQQDNKIPFEFAVTPESIMRYRTYGEPLEILLCSEKLQRLAISGFLNKGVKEIYGRSD